MAEKTTKYDHDLFVIGCGSGGVRATRIAGGYGANVAVADDLAVGLGGTCVNVGCVPKKLFVYGSLHGHHWKNQVGFGYNVDPKKLPAVTWPTLNENKNKEISRLNGIYERMAKGAGADLIKQRAEIVDAHTIQLADGTKRTAEKILVAVGGWPYVPKIPGGGNEHLITSNECFFLKKAPKKVVVWGGGYIAVEFAGIFKGYGAEVHIVIRRDQVLRGFDKDIRRHLTEELVKNGFHVHTNVSINEIKKIGEDNYTVDLQQSGANGANGTAAILENVDLCLAATGRKPKLDGLGLEKAGVKIDEKTGEIIVDSQGKTSCDSIYALGDCTSAAKLTPVALEQGHCFADTFYGKKPRLPDLESIATAVFSYPNVGTVGLTEADAVEKYGKVTVFTSRYTPLKNHIGQVETPIADRGKDYMKCIVDTATDRVVGLHMVGDSAGEIMQGFATAIKCGCTKKQLDLTVGIHPTAAEEFVTMRTAKYYATKDGVTKL